MEQFTTKQEEKLYRALQTLLASSITKKGLPKKASAAHLKKATKALSDYEKHQRNKGIQLEHRYSGHRSKEFWEVVNSLKGADWNEMYSLGVVLQNVEGDVLRMLKHKDPKLVKDIKQEDKLT